MYYHSNKFCIGICEKVLKLLKRVQFRLRDHPDNNLLNTIVED